MSRLAPVAELFWSRGDVWLPLVPPPLGGGTGQAIHVASLCNFARWQHTVSCHRHFGNPDHECSGLPLVATPWH